MCVTPPAIVLPERDTFYSYLFAITFTEMKQYLYNEKKKFLYNNVVIFHGMF